jgi:hypothetical protein
MHKHIVICARTQRTAAASSIQQQQQQHSVAAAAFSSSIQHSAFFLPTGANMRLEI